MTSSETTTNLNQIEKILENIKDSINFSFETFDVTINGNYMAIHNHLAEFKSKKDRDGEYLNLHRLTLAYEFDLKINEILNEIVDDINSCDETNHLTAEVLEPGNVLHIK